MTTPPDRPNPPDREPGGWAAPVPAEPVQSDPQSLGQPERPFDPYRYGAPEQPVPPEYAPPGYTPPPPSFTKAPAAAPPPAYAPVQPGYGYPGGAAQPYPTPPHYSQQYPQPKTGNGKAVAALVLGILAIVFFWTSFIDIILIALGIVFGCLGIGEAKRSGSGRGMAISGLVCALVGALFATIFTVVIYGRIATCINDYSPGSARDHCINQKFGG